jgi:ABC-type nitrate/sulfonate/bicarbonate transport system substrate-binding protein
VDLVKNLKKILAVCITGFMTLSVTACGTSANNNQSNDGKKLQVVKVAFDDAPSEAGIILGDKLGYFEKQGIKYKITHSVGNTCKN